MKNKIVIPLSLPLSLVALIVSLPASAHHSEFAFDNETTFVMQGEVTEWY